MPKKNSHFRRASVSVLVLACVAAFVGYGIAQNAEVTQAEWAVYMVRALKLDWNLPANPKSNHYIERLDWQSGIEFAATGMEEGSSPTIRVDENFIEAEGPAAEALYRVSTIRWGNYGFRVNLANGGAVVKLGDEVFEVYQPENEFRWVDFKRVSLDPGDHTMSVLLTEGAQTQAISVTPPCLISVEPKGGWQPLHQLTYGDLAVTVAKALDLEHELPAMGPEVVIKGESFTRTLEIPTTEENGGGSGPFWLSSGDKVLSAQASFTVPEAGLYTIEAKYLSPSEVRWVVDGCLRAVTCPARAGVGSNWTSVVAVELEAGAHDIDVTLPPNASLDQLAIQRRDDSMNEYLGVASDEGFKMSNASERVTRRRAIAAAVRLRSLFDRWKNSHCDDTIVALERAGYLLLAGRQSTTDETTASDSNMPPASVGSGGADARNPIFPTEGVEQPVASSIQPTPGGGGE